MTQHPFPPTGQPPAPSTSPTQRLARRSAHRPWRVVTVWGLILAASVMEWLPGLHVDGDPDDSTADGSPPVAAPAGAGVPT